ncbi:Cof-type HAD-IIB family hydrolase [Bacillus sp. NPDC060175]|uniref:Cof-type HAD-IIB family hydrolase n=1 Tax=Bacillus sp. NPDC060175 TaxID=3347061 RepID=UPI003669580C
MIPITTFSEQSTLKQKKLSDFKLLAIDMDGTSLNEKHEFSDRTISVIQKVHHHGVTVLLATGRMISAVTKHLNLLETPGLVVSHNGALVKDVHANKIYLHNKINKNVIARILFLYDQSKFILHFNIDDEVLLERPNNLSSRYAQELGITLDYIPSYSDITENPTSVLLMHTKGTLEKILKDITNECPNMFDYVLMPWTKGIWMLQFLPLNTSKGMAVLNVADQLNIQPSEIVSFGDSYNDFEMIQHTGFGIAMGNACQELKNVADYVTKPNTEDGVAYALEELMNNE